MQTAMMMMLMTRPTTQQTPYQTFMQLWQGAGEVGLFRADEQGSPTNTRVWAAQRLVDRDYVVWELDSGHNFNIDRVQFRHLTITRKQNSADVSLVGSGWTASQNTTAAYQGTYGVSITTNDYAQMSTPDGVTTIGAWGIVTGGFGGIALVTIDGDRTLATLLPTAQAMVDAGTLASSALIANGGTLNPTDRVWDQHTADYQWKEFTNTLTAGVHTVRITNTGYRNVSSNFPRIFIAGIGYGGSAVGSMNDSGARLVSSGIQIAAGYAWMLSHNVKPQGASNFEWMGHQVSYANPTISFKLDGVSKSLTQNEYIAGSSVEITINIDLRHPETGSTNVGTWAVTLTLTPTGGLRMQHTVTWAMNNLTVATAYPAMMGIDRAYAERGHNLALVDDEVLTSADDSVNANAQSTAIMLWDAEGRVGSLFTVNDLATVNNWSQATNRWLWVSEFSGGLTINKVYLTRSSTSLTVNAGDVWTADVSYRFKLFSPSASSVLANKGKLL